jgi:hypothetical protein
MKVLFRTPMGAPKIRQRNGELLTACHHTVNAPLKSVVVEMNDSEADPFLRQILDRGHGCLKQTETRVQVYAIKVTLLDTSSPVWRRILVLVRLRFGISTGRCKR